MKMIIGQFKLEGKTERINGKDLIISVDLAQVVEGEVQQNPTVVGRISVHNISKEVVDKLETGKVYSIDFK
jgi:hypothetical protein